MTITYILQILEDIRNGDSEKYGVITDMNGELQKAVQRSRKRIARTRLRAQYELGEMDKAKVAAAGDYLPRFIKALGKIRNLNLEDCRGLNGLDDFMEDENRVNEVVEMAQKISQLSSVSSSAYTPMALGFGLLEGYSDIDGVEIDNEKFETMDPEYATRKAEEIKAFQKKVRETYKSLQDISQCARERGEAINDLSDYFIDGLRDVEKIQMQVGGDWHMYNLVQKMQIGRTIQVAQLIVLLFRHLLDDDGHIDESSRAAIKKAQDELLKRDA